MTRWFTTLLYALMLACAALPVNAAAAMMAAVGEASMVTDSQDAEKLLAPSTEPSDMSSSNDGNAPEVPELFFEPLPHLALPVQMNETPPSIAAALSPHPFLKGPQRPPRAAFQVQRA